MTPRTILLTGATGYVGGRLLPRLLERGHEVRCLVRDPMRARDLPDGCQLVQGDVLTGEGLAEALDGADVAFYLVHSMEGSGSDFARRDRAAADHFGRAVAQAGVARTIYLGGLEDGNGPGSEHLQSRKEVARRLRCLVPELVHMLRRYAVAAGRRPRPVVRLPLVSPRLSSYRVGLVTPVDAALDRPLVEGLGAETAVRRPPPAGINDAPAGFDDAVRAALSG